MLCLVCVVQHSGVLSSVVLLPVVLVVQVLCYIVQADAIVLLYLAVYH